MPKAFNGEINLDIRDSTPDWEAFLPDKAPEGAPNVLVVLYDDTGLRGLVAVRRPDRDADAAAAGRQRPHLLAVAHDRAVLADALGLPDRPQPPPERVRLDLRDRRPGSRATTRTSRRRTPRWRRCCATPAGARSGSARTTTRRSTRGRWARRRRTGRSAWATTASTGSSAARPTSGIPTSPRTTTTSTSPTGPRTATTSRRTSPTRRSSSSATPSSPSPTSPGTCGSARAPTTPRTTRRRSTSTSTRACSTTATRPTASGCCRG